MTEPRDVVSPDDTGSDTFARFKYQAHVTFPYCLRLARGEGVTDVFAEHVEDIAVCEAGSWRFLQVKSREAGRGPWTFAEVVRSGAFHSLWRAYRATGPSLATYEICLEGAARNDDILSTVVETDELDGNCRNRLAHDLGIPIEDIDAFADRLRIRTLPPLPSISAENIRLLGKVAPGAVAGEIEKTYKDAVAAIEAAMTGDRLGGDWPAALFLAPDETLHLRLEAKRIGRERAEQIFAPILRGSPAASPAVQPTRGPRVILPLINLQAFTGRSAELERLELLLLRSEGEKVSSIAGVSGSGGIGKSALACRFAELHQNDFPDGVIGLRVDGREPITIARDFAARAGVDIDPDDDRDASTVMQEVFRERRALLIFDNADDISIRTLLPGGTRCAVIVTTRDRGLPVALGLPELARLDLSPLPPPEALALLEQLVGARVAGDTDNAERICELVGHLPLALQIAGATLQLQPWRTLRDYASALAEERNRLALLAFGRDAALDVRVSFSLSLALLDSSEIDFFASLAVCAQDGFSLMAAAAANGCDESTALDRVTQLFRLSLVNSSSGNGPRFVLHPLLRLFASEKAEERGVLALAVTRHREFYAALVTAQTRDVSDVAATSLLAREIDEIVAAAQSMAREGVLDFDFALRLGPIFEGLGHWHKLAPVFDAFVNLVKRSNNWSAAVQFELQQAKFLTLRGRFADAEELLLALEVLIGRVEPEDGRRRVTAMWLNSLGGVLQRLGRFDDALNALEKSGGIEEELGNPRGLSKVLNSLGGVLQRKGAFERAAAMFRRSAVIDHELGNRRGEAMTLNSLGGVLQRQGDFVGAVHALRRSGDLLTDLGDLRGQAMVLTSLGGVLQRQGDFAGAIEVLQRGAAIEARLGNVRGQAIALNSVGGVLQRQGKFDEAVAAFQESLDIEIELGGSRGQAMVLNSLGGVLQRQGKFDEAVDAFRRSIGIGEDLGDTRHVAMVLNSLGGVLQRQGKFDEAVDAFRRSYGISEELGDERSLSMVLNSLGGVLQRQGKSDEAVDAFRRSIGIGEDLGDTHHVAMVLNSLGGALQRQGKFDGAVDAFRRSYALLVQLGDSRGQAMVLNSLGGVLQRQARFDEAVDAFRASIAIGEELRDRRHLAMVHTAFGRALLRTDREAAVRELSEGFELDLGLNNRKGIGIVGPILVETLVKLGRIREASAVCARALTIAPNDHRLLRLKGDLDRRPE